MIFDVIFLTAFVAGWLGCAYLPWLALSVATRGEAGLGALPLGLFTGLVAALAVPVFGLDNGLGLGLSFLAAFGASAFMLGVRRLSRIARGAAVPTSGPEHRRP